LQKLRVLVSGGVVIFIDLVIFSLVDSLITPKWTVLLDLLNLMLCTRTGVF